MGPSTGRRGWLPSPALTALAAACADGPLLSPEELDAHRLVTALAKETQPDRSGALTAARSHFSAVKAAARDWAEAAEDDLREELAPWLTQGRVEAKAALAALALLEHVRAGARDAHDAVLHAFAVIFAWNAARAGDRSVFGPRFAIYPAVVQLADGEPGLDVDLAVSENANAVDRLCRLALDAYRAWVDEHR